MPPNHPLDRVFADPDAAGGVLLERRRWFLALVMGFALAGCGSCFWVASRALPAAAIGPQIALLVLFVGAQSGWCLLLGKLLPLALARLWPRLDSVPSARHARP